MLRIFTDFLEFHGFARESKAISIAEANKVVYFLQLIKYVLGVPSTKLI